MSMRGEPPPFAELVSATHFSFLRGASPAEDLVLTSLLLGHQGLGIADRNTVAGVVRGWSDKPPSQWLALAEVALCLVLFTACTLHVRLRQRNARAAEAAGAAGASA